MKRSNFQMFSQPKDDKTTCFAIVYENGVPCGMRSGEVKKRQGQSGLSLSLIFGVRMLNCRVRSIVPFTLCKRRNRRQNDL